MKHSIKISMLAIALLFSSFGSKAGVVTIPGGYVDLEWLCHDCFSCLSGSLCMVIVTPSKIVSNDNNNYNYVVDDEKTNETTLQTYIFDDPQQNPNGTEYFFTYINCQVSASQGTIYKGVVVQ